MFVFCDGGSSSANWGDRSGVGFKSLSIQPSLIGFELRAGFQGNVCGSDAAELGGAGAQEAEFG